MKITNEFTVHTPIDRAWAVLTDLAGIAPCLPGAQLTGMDGDDYRGRVKVKVGPVLSEFTGTARFTTKDAGAYRAVIDAKGRDARSAGNAAAVVTAVLSPDGDATRVSVDTDLKITGKLAQFGSGMIKEISTKLLTQFVANIEAKLATEDPSGSAAGAEPGDRDALDGDSAAPADPTPADPVPAGSASASPASVSPASVSPASASPASVSPASPSPVSASPASAGSVPVEREEPDTVSEAAVATAPDSAVAVAPRAPAAAPAALPDRSGPEVRPDPSAGEIDPSAGRTEVAAGTPAPVAPLAVPEPGEPTAPPRVSSDWPGSTAEPEPLDLLEVAGSSIYKRLVPAAIGAAAVAAVVIWLVARR